jgi:lysophospholipase L1-like esterase
MLRYKEHNQVFPINDQIPENFLENLFGQENTESNMKKFTQYVALGDSMSIDKYPSLDLGRDGAHLPAGAASLLHRNHDATWPDSSGKDVSSLYPGISFNNFTFDGATTWDVLSTQLHEVNIETDGSAPTLVTLTIGGNDLLKAYNVEEDLDAVARAIGDNVTECVAKISQAFPESTILVTTVYDPTDGTGIMPGDAEIFGRLPIEHLHTLNTHIRTLDDGARVFVADAEEHFRGHGRLGPPDDQWYWPEGPIEPSARGADGLRELWLQTLDRVNAESRSTQDTHDEPVPETAESSEENASTGYITFDFAERG